MAGLGSEEIGGGEAASSGGCRQGQWCAGGWGQGPGVRARMKGIVCVGDRTLLKQTLLDTCGRVI